MCIDAVIIHQTVDLCYSWDYWINQGLFNAKWWSYAQKEFEELLTVYSPASLFTLFTLFALFTLFTLFALFTLFTLFTLFALFTLFTSSQILAL